MKLGLPRRGGPGSLAPAGRALVSPQPCRRPHGPWAKLNPSVHSNAGPRRCVSSPPRGSEEDEQPQPEAGSISGHGERFPLGLVPPHVTQALGLTGVEPASVLEVLLMLCIYLKSPLTFLLPPSSLVLAWSRATVTKASDEVSAGLTEMW